MMGDERRGIVGRGIYNLNQWPPPTVAEKREKIKQWTKTKKKKKKEISKQWTKKKKTTRVMRNRMMVPSFIIIIGVSFFFVNQHLGKKIHVLWFSYFLKAELNNFINNFTLSHIQFFKKGGIESVTLQIQFHLSKFDDNRQATTWIFND